MINDTEKTYRYMCIVISMSSALVSRALPCICKAHEKIFEEEDCYWKDFRSAVDRCNLFSIRSIQVFLTAVLFRVFWKLCDWGLWEGRGGDAWVQVLWLPSSESCKPASSLCCASIHSTFIKHLEKTPPYRCCESKLHLLNILGSLSFNGAT